MERPQVVVGKTVHQPCPSPSPSPALAQSRVLFLSRETGRQVTDGWESVILSQYRWYFSVLFVRLQAACLTTRLGHLGVLTEDLKTVSESE